MLRQRSLDGPQIALSWLTRIRWLAVIGQLAATATAIAGLGVELPVAPIGVLIGVTLITNLALAYITRQIVEPPTWILPGVVVLDTLLLTAILALTGGPSNPFCTLYVVHVVLAVVLLGPRWTWIEVGLAAICFGLLFAGHVSIESADRPLPAWARDVGLWVSLVLISVLIAYFIGRMSRELRERDLALASMRERNERSARFAAVTALAAGAAHELGSPLGTIAVVSRELQLAASHADVGADIAEDALLIRTEVDRCRAILERMRLEVGDDLRYEAGTIRAEQFIAGAIADLTEDRKARVRTEVESDAQAFHLNSKAILRAVGVLLRNAFEASPAADSKVMLRLCRTQHETVVEVRDTGTGMPPEVLARAGEPFFTTKEMGRGMGMGLFLVKLVVENNDGRLELHSEPGKGTVARIHLPATPAVV